ncbi:hypothetical protein FOG51_00662 [Hanseniaspora uvarum]|nr:hypothetical protein FOG51_00662 [Hanseniaspora uvarum]
MFLSFKRGFAVFPKSISTNVLNKQHKSILLTRQVNYSTLNRLKIDFKKFERNTNVRNYSTSQAKKKKKFGSNFGQMLHKFGLYLSSKEYKQFEVKVLSLLFCCFCIYSYFFYEKYERRRAFLKNVELRKEFQAWKEYEKVVNEKDVTFDDLREISALKTKERTLQILAYNDMKKQKVEEAERKKQEAIETGAFSLREQDKFVNVLKERMTVFEARMNAFLLKPGSSDFSLDNLIKNLSEEDLDKPLSEYEELKYNSMYNSHKMRTRDVLKLAQYNYMIQEYGLSTFEDVNIPHYQSIKTTLKELGLPENGEDDRLLQDLYELESIHKVMPEMDTIDFFDEKALEYDSSIKKEEYIFINGQRKKLAKKLYGDCLETSCGTGRNIPYLDLVSINSITFLDPSQKMLEVCKEKFDEVNDKYGKVAFVKGRCEDLVNEEDENKMKYDCIFETFGLCSQKDPVESLNNMAKLLKKDGKIFLLEHGKSSFDVINRKMTKSMDKRLEHWGCRFNLDLGEIIDDSDLEIVSEKRKHLGTTWIYTLKLKNNEEDSSDESSWLSILK